MTLLRPWWLLALVPLVILLWWLWQRRPASSSWQKVLPPHLARHLLTDQQGKHSQWPLLALAGAWLLAVLALAGPSWSQDRYPLYHLNAGRVLVMDMSLSMRATDVPPDRLTQARFKAIDLVRHIKEGETGLVAYAGDAFEIAPMTRDGSTLIHLISALSPEIMPVQGSRADRGVALALKLLKQAGFHRGDIILVTDGLDKKERDAIDQLPLDHFRLSALVLGTDSGAPLRTLSGTLLKDAKGNVVIPERNLKDTCAVVSGLCITAGMDDNDISALLKPQASGETRSDDVLTLPIDGGRYLLWLLLPLVLLAFRRGLLVLVLVAVLPKPSEAGWFQNQAQDSYQQYQQGHYQAAAASATSAQWRAAALYRQGAYLKAADLWHRMAGAEARYNEGNALARAGHRQQAIDAYNKALALQPDMADARYNRDLLEKQQHQGKTPANSSQPPKPGNKNNAKQQQGNNKQPGKQQPDKKGQPHGQDKQQQPKAKQQPGNKAPANKPKAGEQKPKGQNPKLQPQGAGKGQQKARKAPGKLATKSGSGGPLGPQMSADKVLDAVNDDPGYLLQKKMQAAYQRRNHQGKEKQQW